MLKRPKPITIGDRVRAARVKRGLTQNELANAAGIRPEVISRLENSRCAASLTSLCKIAPVLRITIDELVKGKR